MKIGYILLKVTLIIYFLLGIFFSLSGLFFSTGMFIYAVADKSLSLFVTMIWLILICFTIIFNIKLLINIIKSLMLKKDIIFYIILFYNINIDFATLGSYNMPFSLIFLNIHHILGIISIIFYGLYLILREKKNIEKR